MADGDNWGLEAIHIPEAWDYLKDKELNEINIGVLECYGIQEDHKDLKNNINSILGNYNQTEKEHGTEVTGIIAAEYNNKRDISGISMNKGKIDYYQTGTAGSRDFHGFRKCCRGIGNIRIYSPSVAAERSGTLQIQHLCKV